MTVQIIVENLIEVNNVIKRQIVLFPEIFMCLYFKFSKWGKRETRAMLPDEVCCKV